MKKLFSIISFSVMSLTAMATDYTDTLVVTINGQSVYQSATISLNGPTDGVYTLSLKNFKLKNGDNWIGVGTITLDDCQPIETDHGIIFNKVVDINIAEGDEDPEVPFWLGPALEAVPISLRASLNDKGLQAVIDINMMESLGQIINVHFGEGYQLFNGTFETFKNSNGTVVEEDGTYAEPEYWHSFNSASGDASLVSMAGKAPYISEEKRPGSTGLKSLLLKSTPVKIFGVTIAVANGTITTGRLNAGSTSATDTKNHSEMDMSKTDRDPSGHPFYSSLIAQPDSIVLWTKFKQGKASADHPYATMSATITDGTYYQEPVDKTYTNIVARAENKKIATTGNNWQRLAVPFDYESYASYNVEPKAIMVTMSTNADPGQGSEGDELYVDDVELVYNADITSVSIAGKNIEATAYTGEEDVPEYVSMFTAQVEVDKEVTSNDFAVKTNAKQPFVSVEITDAKDIEIVDPSMPTDADQIALILCYSADLSKACEWVVFIKKAGINYDLNGDGKISAGDIQIIINEMKKPTESQNLKYDLNGDGKISAGDIQIIINEMKK